MDSIILKKKPSVVSITSDTLMVEAKKLDKIRSTTDIFQNRFTAFSVYRKFNYQEKLVDYVVLMMIRLNKFFSDNQQMSTEQIMLTAHEITSSYYYFTIADLKVAFDQMKKEKVYGQLSPNLILEKLESYNSERLEIAETLSINEAKAEEKPITNELLKLWYAKVAKGEVPVNEKDKAYRDKLDFNKFRAEYERKRSNERYLRDEQK